MTGFAEPDQDMAQFLRDSRETQCVQHAGGTGRNAPEASQGGCDSSAKLAGMGPRRVGASRTLSKPAPEPKLKQGSITTFCSPPGLAARRGAETAAAGHKYGVVVQPRTELSTTAPVSDSSCLQEASARGAHLGVGTCAFEASNGNSTLPRAQGTSPQGAEHTGAVENSNRNGVEGQPGLGLPDLESTTSSSWNETTPDHQSRTRRCPTSWSSSSHISREMWYIVSIAHANSRKPWTPKLPSIWTCRSATNTRRRYGTNWWPCKDAVCSS